MFDRAFAAMEKPRSLEASRRIATGVGHVRDAPAHFWPHAKGQGHLGVKLSNTDRANAAELARQLGGDRVDQLCERGRPEGSAFANVRSADCGQYGLRSAGAS